MILIAIVACEIGFWLVLGAGLLTRYLLHRRRLGALLLACLPLVDLVLLALTVVDLSRGARAEFAHGLAAVYLGVSLVFGRATMRWADVRVAHRFAGGPPPSPKPRSGTWARAGREWREFARACLAAALSAGLLLVAIALVGEGGETAELWGWLPPLGLVLIVWLIAWPAWESGRALLGTRTQTHR